MENKKGASSLLGVLKGYLPILDWGAKYNSKTFSNDMIVALIVTMMLIPQSLAYAILAGLPAEVGLYASMAPLVLYAIFVSSRALAVGPVAVASLMTAAAAGQLASQGTPEYLGAAVALAMVSGLLLIAMGFLKLGFMANFLSHPVIAGFITASGLQIAAGQLGPVLGIHAEGESFLDIVISLWHTVSGTHLITAAIGIGSLIFLFWVRKGLKPLLVRFGLG
ncbi:MAG TPA: SulP family inorganic anion transporter, partial [Bacteroidales bacterium]|nr:SulP family inorganic anion transporter [Bacteroidales bacterium]